MRTNPLYIKSSIIFIFIIVCLLFSACVPSDKSGLDNTSPPIPHGTDSPPRPPQAEPQTLLSLPLVFAKSGVAVYGAENEPIDWETFDAYESFTPLSEFNNSCVFITDSSQYNNQLQRGFPRLPKHNGTLIREWSFYGDNGAYVFDIGLYRIYVFEGGELLHTIKVKQTALHQIHSAFYAEGLWYVVYSIDGIYTLYGYDSNSNIVNTIAFNQQDGTHMDPMAVMCSSQGSATLVFIGGKLDSASGVVLNRAEYHYTIEDGSLVLLRELKRNPPIAGTGSSPTKGEIAYGSQVWSDIPDAEIVGYSVYMDSSIAVMSFLDIGRQALSQDHVELLVDYAYVRAFDANGEAIGGYDAFDYNALRISPSMLPSYIRYDPNSGYLYMLVIGEANVEITQFSLDPQFKPNDEYKLQYKEEELKQLGILTEDPFQ